MWHCSSWCAPTLLLLPLLLPGGAKSMDTMAMSEASIKRAHIGGLLAAAACQAAGYRCPR
jgi:hypothetical protein